MNSVTVGTLFTNSRGQMFTVYAIENYNYKGTQQVKITYYPVSDNGLITKTKPYTCNMSDIDSKFTLLDWRF